MSEDQNKLVEALKDAFSDTTPKPPKLVPIPSWGYLSGKDKTRENGKWIDIPKWQIHIQIKNEGGDMDKDNKIKVTLRFMDGLYRDIGGDKKTDEPQKKEKIDALGHDDISPDPLKFDMPSEGEHPFDPEFPIEIIIDEGEEWQSSTRLYLKDPRNY